jgi:hypothetical protein
MDIVSGLKEDVKRIVLNNIFHGLIVLLPVVYTAIICCNADTLKPQTLKLIIEFSTSIVFALIVLCFAFGHLFLKLGHRLEEFIETCLHNEYGKDEFLLIWNQYLKTYFEKGKEPVLIRYYSSMVMSLRFELATMFSVPAAFIISIVIDQYYIDIIPYYVYAPAGVGLFFFIVYLYNEARTGVEALHIYRAQIVDSFKIIQRESIGLMHETLNR